MKDAFFRPEKGVFLFGKGIKMEKKKEPERIADRDEVLAYLTNLLRDDGAGEQTRLRASAQLGKYLGMEEKKLQIGGKAAVTIVDDVG